MTRPERVTWCLDRSAYADPMCDGEWHDHYDLAVDYSDGDGQGKVLYRLDPVGTVYLTPDGHMARIAGYQGNPDSTPPVEDAIYPRHDGWSRNGAAARWVNFEDEDGLWEGANLAPGVRRIVTVPAPGRPAVGSLYARPNGEAWRLRGYLTDWEVEPFTGDRTRPDYSIANVNGSMSGSREPLPDDAVLVWAP